MNFVGDGDDVDAVKLAEEYFGIRITDGEAEATKSVFEFFQLIWSKVPQSEKQGDFQQLVVWDKLCNLLRSINGFSGPVDLETTFFAEHAKVRKQNG